MNFKEKADEIRWGISLIKGKNVSNSLKETKLKLIAEICGFDEDLTSDFIESSIRMQRLNEQVRWGRCFKNTLIKNENYELLIELNLT